MSDKKVILLDMDAITVDMLNFWLNEYNETTGESVRIENLKEYMVDGFVKHPDVLYNILHRKDFFYSPGPMPNAVEVINKLIEKYDVIFVTQRPRKSKHACFDKERWILKHFPNFDLKSIIFAHRKYRVSGDVLFDDNPEHLEAWKKYNPNGKTATINYPYNQDIETDFREEPREAWIKFLDFVNKI